MTLFMSKLLPIFVYPLGLAILLGLLAFVFARFRRLARVALASSLVLLWVTSMPVFSNWLTGFWEAPYLPVAAADLPQTDAIVLLGGIVGQSTPPRIEPDLGEAADRIFRATRLFDAGRAPRIVVSGGNLPWRTASDPEAVLIADLLVELGVPRDAIVLEVESRNTRENAVNTGAIFEENGWQTALLVTSGSHMWRASASFRRAGVDVTAASTDIHSRYPLYDSLLDFLPDARALLRTTIIIKEMIGLVVYRARGWT
jgi:uncharacterized SAM-binding protein YcdF (DUF218 family)